MGASAESRRAVLRSSRRAASPGPQGAAGRKPGRPRRAWRDWRNWADWRWALALTLLAWLHRLAFLCSNSDRSWGFSIFYEGDAERFYQFARAILAGQPYDGGVPFHPPGFPYFLAGVHALLGAADPAATAPHAAIKVVMTLLGSLPVGLIYLLVQPYLGRPSALLAALLCLYSFGLYVISVAPVSEGLYMTLLLAALLLWSRRTAHPLAAPPASGRDAAATHAGRGSVAAHGGLGLLLGALTLVRAEGMLVAVLLVSVGVAGTLPGRQGSARAAGPRRAGRSGLAWAHRATPWALVAAGWLIAVTPWAVRNSIRLAEIHRTLGPELAEPLPGFVPITLYGPLNLALANHPGAAGGFAPRWVGPTGEAVDLGGGRLALRDPAHLRLVLHGDEAAWEWIRAHPGDYVQLVLRKWGLLLEALKLGWTQWDVPGGLRGLRRPVDLFVPHSRAGMWLLAPLLLAGAGLLFARGGPERRWVLIVGALTGTTLLTTALFYGYARAGVVMLPLWYSLIPRGIGPRPGRTLLVAIAALLVIEGWGATAGRDYRASGTPLPGQTHLNPDALMLLEPDPATVRGRLPGD